MKLLDLPAGRLAYWDDGTGAPMVFIHGVGTSGDLWFEDLQPLTDTHRLVVHNRRGYGQSSESPRDWRAHRGDVEHLVDALGIKREALATSAAA